MPQIKEIAWLAGYLEGEGCFRQTTQKRWKDGPYYSYPQINFSTTDSDIADRVGVLFTKQKIGPYWGKKSTKEFWQVQITGKRAIAWMMTLYTFMGVRRRKKIIEVVSHWRVQQRAKRSPNRSKTA